MYNILKNMRTGKGGTTNWMMFFCIFGSHVVFAGIMALGIPDIGAAGLFEMLNAFGNDDNLGGLFILSCTIAWSVNFAMSVYLMKRAHAIWKGNGGEADMKRDVATTAIKEGVLNAA
jgi:hypothetical protein